jgi:hypothetical protein
MNWINGRPDDWGNLFDEPERSACEAGASAMLSALLVYLDEPCKIPLHCGCGDVIHIKHRYLCPQCMAELRGEK